MKRGTADHPKTKRLARTLGIGIAQTIGHLELLWHWTARYAPAGDVGRYDDAEIADACAWDGDPAQIVAALVDCGWIDRDDAHRLTVHDWREHADDFLHQSLARARRFFADGRPPRCTKLPKEERDRAVEWYRANAPRAERPKAPFERSKADEMPSKDRALPCLALPRLNSETRASPPETGNRKRRGRLRPGTPEMPQEPGDRGGGVIDLASAIKAAVPDGGGAA